VSVIVAMLIVCGEVSPELTAFLTSADLSSSAAVNFFSASEVGHMAPLSRFASSLKPSVAYLDLNLSALWKKQTTLPSLLAYAGIPYQVFGARSGGAGFDDLVEPLADSAIRFRHLGDLREQGALPSALRASAFSS
jgi:hypothetical protein